MRNLLRCTSFTAFVKVMRVLQYVDVNVDIRRDMFQLQVPFPQCLKFEFVWCIRYIFMGGYQRWQCEKSNVESNASKPRHWLQGDRLKFLIWAFNILLGGRILSFWLHSGVQTLLPDDHPVQLLIVGGCSTVKYMYLINSASFCGQMSQNLPENIYSIYVVCNTMLMKTPHLASQQGLQQRFGVNMWLGDIGNLMLIEQRPVAPM